MKFNNDIVSFITDKIGVFDKYKKLAGDASTREYYRIYTKKKNYLLCYDNNINKIPIKNYPQFILYRIFKDSGLKIPEIFHINIVLKIFILEDLGDTLLYHYYLGIDEEKIFFIYKQTINALIDIHKISGKSSIPFKLFFNTEKLMFEFDFFMEHAILNYFKFDISENDKNELRNEFLKVSNLLNRKEYFVLNHRDFHSRNIIIKNSTPHIIDYQDARMGLPQYDLVSLLRDSYIQLDSTVMDDLKNYYYGLSKDEGIHNMGRDEFNYYFDIMAFQRNIKAVGSFAYLVSMGNKPFYADFIKPTLNYISDYANRQDELKTAWYLLKKIVN